MLVGRFTAPYNDGYLSNLGEGIMTFVFVSGGFGGSWQWKDVSKQLQDYGHEVYRLTLSGLADRQHISHEGIGLDTHIQDVLSTFEFERLKDVILVGFSYGGIIITAVADRIPERLRAMVYIDAIVPKNGDSVESLLPQTFSHFQEVAVDGWKVEVNGNTQPLKTMKDSVAIVGSENFCRIRRAYILAAQKPDGEIKDVLQSFASEAQKEGWLYYEIPTNHDGVYALMPEMTGDLLNQISQQV